MRALVLALALAACTDFPRLDEAGATIGPAGPPPPLLPFDALEAAAARGTPRAERTDDLEARAAALRARAAVLRQPVGEAGGIDALRARLERLR